MSYTSNYNLFVTNDKSTRVSDWLNEMAGISNSNMTKIDAALHQANIDINSLDSQVAGLTSIAYVSSISEMTDTSRIYVNTTDGNWYKYESGSWVSHGQYGGAEIDPYLETSGAAADAKVVGNKINEIKEELYNYSEPATNKFPLQKGAISASGTNNTSTAWYNNRRKCLSFVAVTPGSIIECDRDINLDVFFYSEAATSSFIDKTGFLNSNSYTIKRNDGSYVRIMIKKMDDSDFGENEYPTVTYIGATSRISELEKAVDSIEEDIEELQPIVETVEDNTAKISELDDLTKMTTGPSRNLVNVEVGRWYPNQYGIITSSSNDRYIGMAEYIPCESSTNYMVSAFDRETTTVTDFYVAWKDENDIFIQRDHARRASTIKSWQVTSPQNAVYMCFAVYNSTYISQENTKLQIEKGSVATSYVYPYSAKDTVVREKTEALEQAVGSLLGGWYPSYFQSNLDQAVENISNNMAAVGVNGETFVFFTDTHWVDNQKHSPGLIHYIVENTNVRNVVCGGDTMYDSSNAVEKERVQDFMKAMKFCPGGLKYITGNHDYHFGDPYSHEFNSSEVYSMFYPQAEMEWQDVHVEPDKLRIYSYFDVPATKARYLNIGMPFGAIQRPEMDWIEEQIANNSEMNIIIFGHYLYDGGSAAWRTEALNLMKLCSAYNNVKAIIYGHIHADKVDYTPSGIPVIATDTDAAKRLSPSLNHNTATVGTITEQAFDTMTVNFTNSNVQCARVGRGKNRNVHGGTTVISISGTNTFETELIDAVWSSSDTNIATVVDGIVTGVANGMAVICAENDDMAEYWSITVGNGSGTVNIAVGESVTLVPIYAATTNDDWQSANSEIATVVEGVVTGMSVGKTAIRVSGLSSGNAPLLEFWDVNVRSN